MKLSVIGDDQFIPEYSGMPLANFSNLTNQFKYTSITTNILISKRTIA